MDNDVALGSSLFQMPRDVVKLLLVFFGLRSLLAFSCVSKTCRDLAFEEQMRRLETASEQESPFVVALRHLEASDRPEEWVYDFTLQRHALFKSLSLARIQDFRLATPRAWRAFVFKYFPIGSPEEKIVKSAVEEWNQKLGATCNNYPLMLDGSLDDCPSPNATPKLLADLKAVGTSYASYLIKLFFEELTFFKLINVGQGLRNAEDEEAKKSFRKILSKLNFGERSELQNIPWAEEAFDAMAVLVVACMHGLASREMKVFPADLPRMFLKEFELYDSLEKWIRDQSPIMGDAMAEFMLAAMDNAEQRRLKCASKSDRICSISGCNIAQARMNRCLKCLSFYLCKEHGKLIHEHVSVCPKFPDVLPDEEKLKKITKCRRCRKQTKLMKCAVCEKVKYCSAKCQKEDWKRHKLFCRKKLK